MSQPDAPKPGRPAVEATPSATSGKTQRVWTRAAVGLGICVIGVLAAILSARMYVASRPLNLREQTTSLADIFEQALVNCRVPKDSIVRGEPQAHVDPGASWMAFAFDVDLPDTMEGSALLKLVERRMQPYNVSLVETSFENFVRKATGALGEREFIEVSIKEKPPKTDLTSECGDVARAVTVLLTDGGIPSTAVTMSSPERKEDSEAIWQYVRINAPCPATIPLDSLEEHVREAVEKAVGADKAEIRVAAGIGTGGTTPISVALNGRPYLDLTLVRTEIEPPAEEIPVHRLPALHASLGQESPETGNADEEELPLDSSGLEDMELGRKLTGVSTPASAIPRIAIIVDDGGYGGPATKSFLALDPNLTFAILPNTPFAEKTAEQAQKLGFEVILHLPMESPEGPGHLTLNMSEAEMQRKLDDDLAHVPGAVGVNNHMGSTFTSNIAAVNRFMACLAGHGLYFIDSRTSANTKAFDAALKNGIPSGMRDVFLDNKKEANYIIGQFNHLMEVAKERGQAIGICHLRSVTAQALVTMLPQLEKNGIKLVHASELVQKPAVTKPLTELISPIQDKSANTAPLSSESHR